MISVPNPVPIYRFLHLDNLQIYLKRRGLHAPNNTLEDELKYRTIHNRDIQTGRSTNMIHCAPGGVIHDYIPFYFGPRSPMLFQLHTGRVEGYNEGQEPIIYLVSTAQAIESGGVEFVFSDGHGIAKYTKWFNNLIDLSKIDWNTVYADYWASDLDDPDRQRRKQAEFLAYQFCNWSFISAIGVLNNDMKEKVEKILHNFPRELHRPVQIKPKWYY